MLLFVDESGHDCCGTPYEVLAGVAVDEASLWNLIEAIRHEEIRTFGVALAEASIEVKGVKSLNSGRYTRSSTPTTSARKRPHLKKQRQCPAEAKQSLRGYNRSPPPERKPNFTKFHLHLRPLSGSHRMAPAWELR